MRIKAMQPPLNNLFQSCGGAILAAVSSASSGVGSGLVQLSADPLGCVKRSHPARLRIATSFLRRPRRRSFSTSRS